MRQTAQEEPTSAPALRSGSGEIPPDPVPAGAGTGRTTARTAGGGPDGVTGTRRRTATRAVLAGYAGYAVIAAVVLHVAAPAGLAAFAAIAAGCTLLAGAVSLVLAPRAEVRPGRRAVIALHLTLIPAQFAFSVPSPITLVGLVLSAVIVALMGPRFPLLSRRARRIWLTLHVGFSAAWLGLSLAMVLLSLVGLLASDPGLRHHAYRLMHVFDLVVVIPVVLAAIVTGLVVSLFSKWGLTRHWWVLIKFAMSVSIPVTAGYWQLWIHDLITATAYQAAPVPTGTALRLFGFLAVGVVFLGTAVVLSTYKPGGRTPWAARVRPELRAGRQR